MTPEKQQRPAEESFAALRSETAVEARSPRDLLYVNSASYDFFLYVF
jgi:hypothetical protein